MIPIPLFLQDLLLHIADDFIEQTVTQAAQLARHRKAATIDVKDVQLVLGKRQKAPSILETVLTNRFRAQLEHVDPRFWGRGGEGAQAAGADRGAQGQDGPHQEDHQEVLRKAEWRNRREKNFRQFFKARERLINFLYRPHNTLELRKDPWRCTILPTYLLSTYRNSLVKYKMAVLFIRNHMVVMLVGSYSKFLNCITGLGKKLR